MDKNSLGCMFSIKDRQYRILGHHYARPDLLVVNDCTEYWGQVTLFLPQNYVKQRLSRRDWTFRGCKDPDFERAVPPVYDVDGSCVDAFRSKECPNRWTLEVNNRSLSFTVERILPTDLVIASTTGCLEVFSEAVVGRYGNTWKDWQKEYVRSLQWMDQKGV